MIGQVVIMKSRTARKPPQPNGNNRERRDDLARDFIRIELELADTFCNLAHESHSPEKARQHRFNARRAIDAALNALTKVEIDAQERDGFLAKIESLDARLGSSERHA
jgi:hypothetical protein